MIKCLTRIYTEGGKEKVENIKRDTSYLFEGFSIIEAKGFYKGKEEKSCIIELIHDNTAKEKESILALCEGIKRHNQQECVYLVNSAINADLI